MEVAGRYEYTGNVKHITMVETTSTLLDILTKNHKKIPPEARTLCCVQFPNFFQNYVAKWNITESFVREASSASGPETVKSTLGSPRQ